MQIIHRSLCVALLVCLAKIAVAQSNPRVILGRYHNRERVEKSLPRSYLGRRLQGSGLKPLHWKSEPTTIGWSEVTLTAVDTFGPSVGLSVGVCQVTIKVFEGATDTVAPPVWPG